MPPITSAGPEGYDFQYLVTVWVALMLWENVDLRVVPEEGEDFLIECSLLLNGKLDVQVKRSPTGGVIRHVLEPKGVSLGHKIVLLGNEATLYKLSSRLRA